MSSMPDLSIWGNIIYIIFQALYISGAAIFLARMLEPRWKKIPTAVLYALGYWLIGVFVPIRTLRTVLIMSYIFVYPFFAYKGSFFKRLAVEVVAYVWLISSDIFSYATINVFNIENPDLKMVLACTLCAIVMFGGMILTGYFVKVIKTVKLNRTMLLVLTIPLSQFLLFMIFDMRFVGTHDGEIWTTKYNLGFCLLTIVAYAFCFVADILASRAFLSIMKNAELKASVDALEYKNQLNLQYYSDLKQNETELRKIKHDFSNIMLVMETLLDTTDSPEAHKLFESLSQDVDNIQLAYYSENSFINAVLSNKVKLCKEKGISAEVNALVPTDLTIDEMDLCRALVNLIDNAIEASERDSSGTEKKVDINIFDKEGYLFIKTKNNAERLLDKTQKQKEEHGFGKKILEDLAKKYDGEYIIRMENDLVIALLSLKNTRFEEN